MTDEDKKEVKSNTIIGGVGFVLFVILTTGACLRIDIGVAMVWLGLICLLVVVAAAKDNQRIKNKHK